MPEGSPVTIDLNGLDAAGTVVASDSYTVNRYAGGSALDGHVHTLSMTGAGIVSVETSGLALDCGWAVDDFTFTVENLPPTADSGESASGSEGSPVSLSGAASSDSDGVIVEYAWDCTDDGVWDVVGAQPTATCTYGDDGTYTVRLLVTDDDGATGETILPAAVANVDPSIDSIPPTEAFEGQLLSYQATRIDPADANDPPLWTLAAGPAGMAIDASTGLLEWTPTAPQAQLGSAAAQVSVDDGDGGSDTQSFTLTVVPLSGDDDDSAGDDDDDAAGDDDDDSGDDDDDSTGDDDDATGDDDDATGDDDDDVTGDDDDDSTGNDDDDVTGDDDDATMVGDDDDSTDDTPDCGCSVRAGRAPPGSLFLLASLTGALVIRRRRETP